MALQRDSSEVRSSSGLWQFSNRNLSWRWIAAGLLFVCAFIGMQSGVGLTERPSVTTSDWLTKAYYSLGLFVVGGLDLGVPHGGPLWARTILWLAYFGAPLLTASAVIDAVLRALAPQRWQLRRLNDHYIVNGTGRLPVSYLEVLRQVHPKATVVVIDVKIDPVKRLELERRFNARVVIGDISTEFMIRQLHADRAKRIALFAVDDFQCFEAASQLLNLYPGIGSKILLHCSNLRFLRTMANNVISRECTTFNAYQFASQCLVRDQLIEHFHKTAQRDVVVLAGYGRFGQTILEELDNRAKGEISTVALIDIDAERRVMVADEQQRLSGTYRRIVLQGNVGNPRVWNELNEQVNLATASPVVILGTGDAADNLRTALWIRQKYPNALVLARFHFNSQFAQEISREHDIIAVSIVDTLKANLPAEWLA